MFIWWSPVQLEEIEESLGNWLEEWSFLLDHFLWLVLLTSWARDGFDLVKVLNNCELGDWLWHVAAWGSYCSRVAASGCVIAVLGEGLGILLLRFLFLNESFELSFFGTVSFLLDWLCLVLGFLLGCIHRFVFGLEAFSQNLSLTSLLGNKDSILFLAALLLIVLLVFLIVGLLAVIVLVFLVDVF